MAGVRMNEPTVIGDSAIHSSFKENRRRFRRDSRHFRFLGTFGNGENVCSTEKVARTTHVPATTVKMKGRPKRRKGWLLSLLLYKAPRPFR